MAKKWHEYSEAERVSFSLEWDHLMTDYIGELHDLYGEMNPEQHDRYRELWARACLVNAPGLHVSAAGGEFSE